MDDNELLTITEAADLLRTPVATLRWWRNRGIGPDSFKIGRRVVYLRNDLAAWIAAQRDADRGDRPATPDHHRRRASEPRRRLTSTDMPTKGRTTLRFRDEARGPSVRLPPGTSGSGVDHPRATLGQQDIHNQPSTSNAFNA